MVRGSKSTKRLSKNATGEKIILASLQIDDRQVANCFG